jgi:hypothetical protein
MNSTKLDLYFANTSNTQPAEPAARVTPAELAEESTHTKPAVQSEPSPTPKPVGNPTKPTVPLINPDQIELAREQREADRLARLARSRAAKQRMSELKRATVRPPAGQMTTQGPKPAQPDLVLKPNKPIRHPELQTKPPARLRLDLTGKEEEEEEDGKPSPTRRLLNLITGPFRNFYGHCPNCGSDEVYAVNASGRFIRSKAERALVLQKLSCERCMCAHTRPGLLLGAPEPKLRPRDEELYS